jgi:uncharacterized protein (TIGR00369 family)
MTDDLAALTARVAATHGYALARGLGFRLLSLDPAAGSARCAFEPSEAHLNAIEVLHGGVVCTMLDIAMTMAALGTSGLGSTFPTLELKASFLSAARPGPMQAEGRVRRLGRGVAFLEAELADASGRLLATASATARVLPRTRPA